MILGPELKAQASFSDRLLSVRLVTFYTVNSPKEFTCCQITYNFKYFADSENKMNILKVVFFKQCLIYKINIKVQVCIRRTKVYNLVYTCHIIKYRNIHHFHYT